MLGVAVPSHQLPSYCLLTSLSLRLPSTRPLTTVLCHIPALKNTSKFCMAISTPVLPATPRKSAIGMSTSISLRQELPFLNTRESEPVHPYRRGRLPIQIAIIYSKHSVSQLSLYFHCFSEIPSPLPFQHVDHN